MIACITNEWEERFPESLFKYDNILYIYAAMILSLSWKYKPEHFLKYQPESATAATTTAHLFPCVYNW